MNHYVNHMPSLSWIENPHKCLELPWILSLQDDRLLVWLPFDIMPFLQTKHASEDARFAADEHPLMNPVELFANLWPPDDIIRHDKVPNHGRQLT